MPVGGGSGTAYESGIQDNLNRFTEVEMVLIRRTWHLAYPAIMATATAQAGPEVSILQHPRIALNGGIDRHDEQSNS